MVIYILPFYAPGVVMIRVVLILLGVMFASVMHLAEAGNRLPVAITQPIPIAQLVEYPTYSPAVRALILKAQLLSQMKLTYLYGSSDPKNKGMDCSGTIYYLLNQMKINHVPRQSDELLTWVEDNKKLYRVNHNDFSSPDFSNLNPGDLLFWSGTYSTHRRSGISHVMLYLGKNKNGDRLIFGSSDGRTYQGKKMWGVSVFDFLLPNGAGPQRFVGYGRIPEFT
jgi:hypothetical protein